MLRMVILVVLALSATLMLRAEGSGPQGVNMALAQVQNCLELGSVKLEAMLPAEQGGRSGFTLRSLLVTLAIGCLSILFCVPAALVAEYFSGAAGTDPTLRPEQE